jgi:hypothetical protein
LENTKPIQYKRTDMLWCPGRGVGPVGMDWGSPVFNRERTVNEQSANKKSLY